MHLTLDLFQMQITTFGEQKAVEYLKDKIFPQKLFEINLLNKRKKGNKSEQQKEAITNVH